MWSLGAGRCWVWGCVLAKSDVEVVTVCDGAPFRRFDGESFPAAEVTPVGSRGLGLILSHQHIVV